MMTCCKILLLAVSVSVVVVVVVVVAVAVAVAVAAAAGLVLYSDVKYIVLLSLRSALRRLMQQKYY
jgi:hypothetical protein